MCVMKPSKVLGMVATMVTALLMSFPILSATANPACDNVPHDATHALHDSARPSWISNADCPWNNHSPLIAVGTTEANPTELCYHGKSGDPIHRDGGGGGGVNCLRFWHNLPSSRGERTFIPWGTDGELRSLTEHLDGKKAKGRDAGWCLNAPTKWQQGTSISSTVVGQPSWTRTDTCIMPSGLDNVIGKPIGLENLCRPLFCTPGDTKIVKGPTNIADPGPTTQPGPTTDPGPTDNPRTSRFRYSPNRAEVCSTYKTVRWEWSANGRAPWTLVSMVYGLKDCSASDDDDDTTETDNDGTDGDDTGGGDTNGGDTNGGDTTSVTCPTLPDASTICKGRNGEVTCSDSTTRTVAGTKTTSDCPQTWTPHSNTVCYPDVFTQTSSLGDHITRTAFGEKLIDECLFSCPDVPDPSDICVGETEQWTCDGQPSRTIVGTSNAYPCPATCVPDPDPTPSSLCVGDHVIVTCSYGQPRDVYGTSNDCPPCESSKCATTCDQTYLAPDGSDPETYAQGCPSGTTFTVTNDCEDKDKRGLYRTPLRVLAQHRARNGQIDPSHRDLLGWTKACRVRPTTPTIPLEMAPCPAQDPPAGYCLYYQEAISVSDSRVAAPHPTPTPITSKSADNKEKVMLRMTISLCCLLLALSATATKIDVRYVDEDGHGYQDTAPAAPVEGNTGTTKGEQAQVAFEYVSSLVERTVWIPDEVPLRIEAWHLPSGQTEPWGIASARGTNYPGRDLYGNVTPIPGVVAGFAYPKPLEMALSGQYGLGGEDLGPDGRIGINSSVDWDHSTHFLEGTSSVSSLPTILHEYVHILGFVSDINYDGSFTFNPDIYDRHMVNNGITPRFAIDMTDEQRAMLFSAGEQCAACWPDHCAGCAEAVDGRS